MMIMRKGSLVETELEVREMYELKDLKLKVLDNKFAHDFIAKWHYSKSCSNIVVAIGEFNGLDLVNCIVFNYCCGREMAKQVMVGGDNSNTLELSRMVSIEPKPKNLESFCIARACEWLKENMPNVKVVISYADNSMGHKGYCYQASGFTYYGQSRPTKEHFLDGERIHERVLNSRYGTSSPSVLKEKLGDRYVYKESKESKSRYYKIIAQNKTDKKQILKNILVESLPFPKGDNKRYDMTKNGSFSKLDKESADEINTDIVYQPLDLFDFASEDK